MTEIVITLPLCPTTNHLFAGSGQKRYRTREYDMWLEAAGWELNIQRPRGRGPLQVQGQVEIHIEVREPRTDHQEDLDNRAKASLDLLVKNSVIQGDSNRYVRKLTMTWNKDIDGIRITIKPWQA
jgi:Holliday junction resolvase RusA-like endonuclease